MALRGSHLVSFAIMAGIAGWMFTGKLIEGGLADANTPTIAEREAKRTVEAFRVRVREIQPASRAERLSIRGRTEAEAMVTVRAETGGTVQSRAFEKGQVVKAGDLLCILDQGVRSTSLAQAEAVLAQAQADYEANEKLVQRGFATKSKLRGLKAAVDSAKAVLATAKQDMKRTEVRATADGQIQAPFAEAGDNLAPGGVCATLMDMDPMLFSGQVPERDIDNLKPGMAAGVALVSGDTVTGSIRYISPVADPSTRTFKVEIEIPNRDRSILDGMTAVAEIDLAAVQSYQIEPSWLTLDDDGRIGVRAVKDDNTVKFVPVKMIAQDDKFAWVDGLSPGLRIITLGQNYVSSGELVEPVTAEQIKAAEDALAKAEPEPSS